MFTCVLQCSVACTVLLVPKSFGAEGADRIDGQMCGDTEGPFSGVTNSGRVWRKGTGIKRRLECVQSDASNHSE